MEQESRYKLFIIDPYQILNMLNWDQRDKIALPVAPGLPEGSSIMAINYDPVRNCFLARVYNDDFDVVELGEEFPIHNISVNIEMKVVNTTAYKIALGLEEA